jgi:HEAT repeat protein
MQQIFGSMRPSAGLILLAATLSAPLMLSCETTPDKRRASIYELKAAGDLEAIRPFLEDADPEVRATALNALVTLGAPDAVELAAALLEDEAGFPRSIAAKLLGDLEAVEQRDALVRHLLEDPDPWVRRRAAETLELLGGETAVEGLVRGLSDPVKMVRLAAVRGVRKLDPDSARSDLARLLLDDPEWEIRVQAAMGLGRTGAEDILPVLEAAEGDSSSFVRSAVANALRVHEEIRQGRGQDS